MISNQSLCRLVEQYKRQYRPYLRRELEYFAGSKSLSEAIKRAALSTCACGRVLSHQRRNGRKVLGLAESRLQSVKDRIRNASDFKALHSIIKLETRTVEKFGPLAVYDVALRIGVYRGFYPEKVFLHTGARRGAKCEEVTGHEVSRISFRTPLRSLAPHEIENFLCIFEDVLCGGVKTAGRPRNKDCKICGAREMGELWPR
ncbi:hypothetical protein [Undibacter mobilis]|uniref:hypothetical protein n=1 Tax=Undibacter mobilis TaxID=2292256 RepID=UPI0011C04EF7|nr:hypothetical protein [Undibacter mobilis]